MAAVRDTARTAAIVETFHGFRSGRDEAVAIVRGWVQSVVRSGNWRFSDADGVVQDTLLKLVGLAAADKVRDPESFQKFATTVAKNTCVTVYHRERSRRQHEDTVEDYDEPTTPAQAALRLEAAERIELLAEIVQRLPESCRKLWDTIYHQRKKPEEAAAALGISPGNVRVRVHRCTDKARTIYRDLTLNVAPRAEGMTMAERDND